MQRQSKLIKTLWKKIDKLFLKKQKPAVQVTVKKGRNMEAIISIARVEAVMELLKG